MENTLRIIIIIALSYLVGSFPTALIVSKKKFGFDIREKGSGNVGSTNAFRILGWKWGLVVQVVDVLKGVFAVIVIAGLVGSDIDLNKLTSFQDFTIIQFVAGIAAVCGHIWSVFANFRGGKGINTAAGFLIGIAPIDVTIAIGIFILAVIFSGYISLGSMAGAVAFPSSIFIRYNILKDQIPGYEIMIYFSVALALLLLFTHRKNIKRLLKGTENRFSKLQILKRKAHAVR
jgi:glycerol-3-phosphate acyltransferase PlsY